MYSKILGAFSNSLNSLRNYIEYTDEAINRKVDNMIDEQESFPKFMALLLRQCVKWKEKGNESYFEKILGTIPPEIPEEVKNQWGDFICGVEKLVDECGMTDGSINTYRSMPKEIRDEYKRVEALERQKEILYNGSLMLLVTYYENLVARLFKEDFIKYPERIHLDSKCVTYKILEELNDVEEIKKHLVEEEVMGMMYKSHEEWIKYFKDKIKLQLLYINENIQEITEIIARRNLFVHNNGIVNSVYISLTGNKDVSKGTVLSVGKEYLQKAIDTIEIAGFCLVTEIWLKNCQGDEEEVRKLDSLMYNECLENGKWLMGRYLYGICLSDKKLSEAYRLMFKINMWQCDKRLGNFEKIKSTIEDLDLSACSPQYRLAVYALLENEAAFFEEFDSQSDIDEETLKEWPIFSDIRRGDEFQRRFAEVIESGVEEGV